MNQALTQIKILVEDFQKQESAFLHPDYSEQQVREDFINKFFVALGWDVTHVTQKNPYEQEVKIENKVKTGASHRRADYAFFIAPNFHDVKFFVEAKKPSRNLCNADDYFQTIRYGWNKGTPLAMLTDFEELHILDCRYKPDIQTALERKIVSYHYTDYANEEIFAKIFYLFSRNAVANNSLERFADTLPKPRKKNLTGFQNLLGLKSVDEAFLELLDEYRETLAKAFKKHNQQLISEELTEAVQRTIDRLVFIRFLEDKQIEEQQVLNYRAQPSAWKAFIAHCKSLEPKYNGLVFKPHRIIDSKEFVPPDDNLFAGICDELSDPTSPYDFDQIPISILGSIYERFLGKVVHATPKQAKVEDKPEFRKAGGVYYTPEYIVRYIVSETVGKILNPELPLEKENEGGVEHKFHLEKGDKVGLYKLELKSPEEISQLSFADIACGSGSFLIEIYSQLLDHHTKYYNAFPEKAKKGETEIRDGKIVLSLKKKQEILLNNIYGVDIDFQATEVTQLSLYLKLLEDVTMNDAFQFSLLKEKILPDLRFNIVCGNSLVDNDINGLFAEEEKEKLKPMNFSDAFPKIIKQGGFDAIVGNPPWIDIKGMDPSVVDYYFKKYSTVENRMNIYAVFIQIALSLLKREGTLGYITPSSYTTQSSYKQLRELLLLKYSFTKLIRLPDNVFKNVIAESIISILENTSKKNDVTEVFVYDAKKKIDTIVSDETSIHHFIQQENWKQDEEKVINLFVNGKEKHLITKIKHNTKSLALFCEFSLGITPYDKYKGHTKSQIKNREFHSTKKENITFKPLLNGGNITRYFVRWDGKEW
ncbi:MAG: N-6 DNA methylase, partial [Bacteroidota bacterium]